MPPQTAVPVNEVSDSNQNVARKQEKSRSAIPASQNKTAKTKSKTGNSNKPKNPKRANSSSARQLSLNSSSAGHSSLNLSSAHHLPANSSTQPERMAQPTIDVTRGVLVNPYSDTRGITLPSVNPRNTNRHYNDAPHNVTRNQTPGPVTFSRTGNNIASNRNTRSYRDTAQIPAVPMSAQNDPRMPTSTGSRFTTYFANAVEGILNFTSPVAHASNMPLQWYPAPSFDLQNLFGTPVVTPNRISIYDVSATRMVQPQGRGMFLRTNHTIPAFMYQDEISGTEKWLIGTGRFFVKTGQGIKQFSLEIGEGLKIIETGSALRYTARITEEAQFYYNTPVGRSRTARIAEHATEFGVFSSVPVGVIGTSLKGALVSTGMGMSVGAVQVTDDGALSTRLQYIATGGLVGYGGYKIVDTSVALIPKVRDIVVPIFSTAKTKLENYSYQTISPTIANSFSEIVNRWKPTSLLNSEVSHISTGLKLETCPSWYTLKYGNKVQYLNPAEIRFSQASVNGASDLVSKMERHGWNGPPIDVVKLSDGSLVTLDNTRVLAASKAKIYVRAKIHSEEEILPKGLMERFETERNGMPNTWGEAVHFRINKQSSAFKNRNRSGSKIISSWE